MNFDELYLKNPNLYGNKPSEWIVKIKKYIQPPAKVLDLGICYGRNALYLARKGYEVTGVDISQVAIDQCLGKAEKDHLEINCIRQNINDFEFVNNYDVIYSTATLHYLGSQNKIKKIFDKMKDHTRSGGLNIISAPTDTKIAMEFPYYFKKNELQEYHKDWDILEYKEEDDHFSNGKIGTIAFIIARKK